MSVLRESDDGQMSRGSVSCHATALVCFWVWRRPSCAGVRGPEREGSAQLGRRGVAAGEEGVLLGAEIESTTNKTP